MGDGEDSTVVSWGHRGWASQTKARICESAGRIQRTGNPVEFKTVKERTLLNNDPFAVLPSWVVFQ